MIFEVLIAVPIKYSLFKSQYFYSFNKNEEELEERKKKSVVINSVK